MAVSPVPNNMQTHIACGIFHVYHDVLVMLAELQLADIRPCSLPCWESSECQRPSWNAWFPLPYCMVEPIRPPRRGRFHVRGTGRAYRGLKRAGSHEHEGTWNPRWSPVRHLFSIAQDAEG